MKGHRQSTRYARRMNTVLRLKQAGTIAYDVFGSASCSELAGVVILCLVGLIVSVVVLIPGDQTPGSLHFLCALCLPDSRG